MSSLSLCKESEKAKYRLCIRHLPSSLTEDELFNFLKTYTGNIERKNIFFNPGTISKYSPNDSVPSSAFITFLSEDKLRLFYNEICDKMIQGKSLLVEFAPIQSMSFSNEKNPFEGTIEQAFVKEQNEILPAGQDTASLRTLEMGPTIDPVSLESANARRKPFKLELSSKKSSNGDKNPPQSPSSNTTKSFIEKALPLPQKKTAIIQNPSSQTETQMPFTLVEIQKPSSFNDPEDIALKAAQRKTEEAKPKGKGPFQISKKNSSLQFKFELRKKT